YRRRRSGDLFDLRRQGLANRSASDPVGPGVTDLPGRVDQPQVVEIDAGTNGRIGRQRFAVDDVLAGPQLTVAEAVLDDDRSRYHAIPHLCHRLGLAAWRHQPHSIPTLDAKPLGILPTDADRVERVDLSQ